MYIYYADISHNERKWRYCYIVCADKMPHAMRWPMSFYTTTQLLFLFFNFHSNFHPVSLFPAVNWERYISFWAVQHTQQTRTVRIRVKCVCAAVPFGQEIGWRSSNAGPSAANGSRAASPAVATPSSYSTSAERIEANTNAISVIVTIRPSNLKCPSSLLYKCCCFFIPEFLNRFLHFSFHFPPWIKITFFDGVCLMLYTHRSEYSIYPPAHISRRRTCLVLYSSWNP